MRSPTLVERLHALPPELYDEILELTFTPTSTVIRVDGTYQFPAALQVDRATRSKLAKQYYGANTTFYVEKPLLYKWLGSLAEAQVEVHCEIRADKETYIIKEQKNFNMRFAIIQGLHFHRAGGSDIFASLLARVKSEVDYGEPERTVWMNVRDLDTYLLPPNYDPREDATTWCKRKFGST